MAWRTLPVKAKRQRSPAGLRTQFFLADIVRPAAAALPYATAEDQHIDQPAVVHIHMEPVVHARADDDHRTTVGFFRVFSELARDADHLMAGNAGDFFRPGWRIGFNLIVAGGAVSVVEAAIQTVVSHRQIVDAGDQRFAAVGQFQALDRQLMQHDFIQRHAVEMFAFGAAEVREADVRHLIVAAEQAQL